MTRADFFIELLTKWEDIEAILKAGRTPYTDSQAVRYSNAISLLKETYATYELCGKKDAMWGE